MAVGVDYSRIGVRQNPVSNQFGSFLISGFDVRRFCRFCQGGSGTKRFDDPSAIYRRQVGSSTFDSAATQIAFFAQDKLGITPTLR